jgi:hypothetical protein
MEEISHHSAVDIGQPPDFPQDSWGRDFSFGTFLLPSIATNINNCFDFAFSRVTASADTCYLQ